MASRAGALLWAGVALMVVGQGYGLVLAPPDAAMGDVARILYVHVPTAWTALLAYAVAFGAAVSALWTGSARAGALLRASAEAGVVLNALMLGQGFLWAQATWGAWWAPDFRLLASMAALVGFGGVLAASALVRDPGRRLVAAAAAAVVSFATVPAIVLAVRWTRTIHQDFSTPATMDPAMWAPLLVSFAGTVLAGTALVRRRWKGGP